MTLPTTTLQWVIPGRPQPKQRPRVLKSGYTYTPKATAEYEARVIEAAKKAKQIPQSPVDTPLMIIIWAYMPIPKSWSKKKQELARREKIYPTSRPDIDNLGKAVMDACNGIMYKDDALIVDLILHKRYSDEPRVEVVITDA